MSFLRSILVALVGTAFVAGGASVSLGAPTSASAPTAAKVRVEPVSTVQSIATGETFWIALHQRIAPGWPTYWMNPGDSGEPPRVEWINTPHMYVIDKAGTLVYAGAIDDRPTSRKSDVPGAQNYVRAALEAVAAGQPVKTPVTRAYGCTVKYA